MRDFLPAIELFAKAVRSGLATVGALVDCGIPRQHAGAQWLTDAEAETEVWEAPLSADFTDDRFCPDCGGPHPPLADWERELLEQSKTPVVSATAPVEGYPPADVPPTSAGADLTHLAQCLRDAVGDHYDFACRPYDQFPFWHDDQLIDAFDWEGATNAFLEDIRRAYDPQHPQYDEELQK